MVTLHKYKEEDTGMDSSAISHGNLIRQRYGGYFGKQGTIKTALATDPQDFDDPGYTVEKIWEILNRKPQYLYVANDDLAGGENLFVIAAHRHLMEFSPELMIPPQQEVVLQNVYEVRLRSPKKGLAYRISEQPLKLL